ncbi:restriction endonuclease subunit S [bacterium]|nr:restriction endonuclease subunit S [bacterium]
MDDEPNDRLVETEIGVLPSSWRLCRFDELFDSKLGKMLSQKARLGSAPRPYLRNANVQWSRVDVSDLLEMDFSEDEQERFRLVCGDILICEGGEVGRTAIWRGQLEECYFQKAIHRARPINGAMDSEFFMYHMMNSFLIQNTYGTQGTETTIAHLPAVKLKALLVPAPPIEEQRAIARLLRTVQQAKEATEKAVAAARQLKQSIMRHLFTYGPVPVEEADRVPLKETDFGAVPEMWKTIPLSDCAVVQTGVAKGRKLDGADAVSVPYLRVANVQDGYLDLSEMKNIDIRRSELSRYSLQPGDVVLTEGGDFDKLGRGFIWNGEVPGCVHQNHVFAVRADRRLLVPEFLAYLTQSPYGKAYFLSVAHKTTNLACINTTKLKAFPTLVPPKNEQKEIAGCLSAVDAKIGREEAKRNALDCLFKSLLHKLMTGKLRVAGEES